MKFGQYKTEMGESLGSSIKKSEKKRQAAIKKAKAFMKRMNASPEKAAKEFDLLPADVKKLTEEVEQLDEARGVKLDFRTVDFANVQPWPGKPAVDNAGIDVDDSIVVDGDLIAVRIGDAAALIDPRTNQQQTRLSKKQLQLIKKIL